jgi:hypothetical protein
LEFKEDIQEALSFVGNDAYNYRLIALRPVVAYELDKRGLVYTGTLDYAGEDERIRQGIENLGVVQHLTSQIDNEIPQQLRFPSIKPGHYSFYYLKILFDVVVTKIQLLKKIIESEKPSEIIVFLHKPIRSSPFFPFDDQMCLVLENVENFDILHHPFLQ